MSKGFPTLFQANSKGGQKYWTITVREATIRTEFGVVGGTPQVTYDTLKTGKNIGKANATTAEEQAVIEAQAKWNGKKKKGYVDDPVRAKAGEDDVEGGELPMLAHKYSEQAAKIEWPAFAQPKFDGSRCMAVYEKGECTLWTRTRKPITGVPHIARAVEAALAGTDERIVLDGELYNHRFKDNFEHIMHLVRQTTPTDGYKDVEYHIYDIAGDGTFQERNERLNALLNEGDDVTGPMGAQSPLVLVQTWRVETPEDLLDVFNTCRYDGYEGAMVRNAAGRYVGKRSYDLQKVKEFDDAEFEIVDVEEGRGRLQGHVGAFVCQTPDEVRFSAKMAGDTAVLKQLWEGPRAAWQGKFLTVQYQGLTGKNGVPRFPVGLRIRND